MVFLVTKYGNPVLRKKGAHIEKFNPELQTLITHMYETMYDAHGIGLAAQQVGQALQLAIIDLRGLKDRPSTLEINGLPMDVEDFMPLTLINPQIKPLNEPVSGPEGCLSFPEMYADITRPESIDVVAMNERGEPLHFKCGGLLSRAIQHEYDHLQGILFIDRMSRTDKIELQEELDLLQETTKSQLESRKNKRHDSSRIN